MSHITAMLSWQKQINTPTRQFKGSGSGRSSLLSETPCNLADELNITWIWSGFLGWYTPKWGKCHVHPCLRLLPPAFAPIWRVSMVLSYWDCCLVLTTHPVALEPHGHVWRLCPLTGSNFLSSWVFYWGFEACHYHGWQPWSLASIFFFVPR